MSLKRIAAAVLPFAKTLGTALGGPAGPIVNMALDAAGKALNVAPEPAAIEAAIAKDPEAAAKLHAADLAFETRMAELRVDVYALEHKDKVSARELAQKSMVPHVVLSAVFVLGYFYVLGLILTGEIAIPEGQKELIALLIGILTTNIPIIMQFWFGSSWGSKRKTDMMNGGAK